MKVKLHSIGRHFFDAPNQEYTHSMCIFVGKGKIKTNCTLEVIFHTSISGTLSLFIPKDYTSDGASTPFDIWQSWYKPAGIIHDFLYRETRKRPYAITRKEVDKLFYLIMISDYTKMPKWMALISYYGVRLFGWRHYQK